MYLCMYICVYVSMYISIYVCPCMYMYVCVYVSTYLCMYVCMYGGFAVGKLHLQIKIKPDLRQFDRGKKV